jgi:hypothetical protein
MPAFEFLTHQAPARDTAPKAPGELHGIAGMTPPWGELEFTTIEIERPSESFPVRANTSPVRWFFENLTETQVLAVFENSGLASEHVAQLADRKHWQESPEGWTISPPRDLVRDLRRSSREQIYAVLRLSSRNSAHRNPLRIPQDKFERWLEKSGLPPAKQELFRKFTYVQGGAICFSDCEAMEPECSPEEAKLLASVLSRVPALLVRLRVGPASDTEALMQYWGRAGRGRAMKPFLDSLAAVPGGETISVSAFFPELMRMKLYTYPIARTNATSPVADCFWTSLNFFNKKPDDRFYDGAFSRAVLSTHYARVNEDWLFGDLIVLTDDTGMAVHMCVYVADDVVFTKNGADVLEPWVLMRFAEMLARYPSRHPLRVTGFRRLELLSQPGPVPAPRHGSPSSSAD